MWYMEHTTLHFLKQLPQVVIIKWQCPHQQRIQNYTTGPYISLAPIVFLSLQLNKITCLLIASDSFSVGFHAPHTGTKETAECVSVNVIISAVGKV
jgi:hypothetical protein